MIHNITILNQTSFLFLFQIQTPLNATNFVCNGVFDKVIIRRKTLASRLAAEAQKEAITAANLVKCVE